MIRKMLIIDEFGFSSVSFRSKNVKKGPEGGTNRYPISFPPEICLKNVIRMVPGAYWSFGPKMVDK